MILHQLSFEKGEHWRCDTDPGSNYDMYTAEFKCCGKSQVCVSGRAFPDFKQKSERERERDDLEGGKGALSANLTANEARYV